MNFKYFEKTIKYDAIRSSIVDRTPDLVQALIKKDHFVIDVHTHFFDMKCLNKRYFLIRMIKDFLGLKAVHDDGQQILDIEQLYNQEYTEHQNWQQDLLNQFNEEHDGILIPDIGKKGVIDLWNVRNLLHMNTMAELYWYYINNFSLAKSFENVPNDNVLTSVLMMDLEMGWETSLQKTFFEQIEEVKQLALKFPVLPFLACDPRRTEFNDPEKNLYELFNKAFCEGNSFFGIKIYPAMGYHPSDYRLWPIYEICEHYKIPIISHNGGEAVSTNQRNCEVFSGKQKITITGNTRAEVAYQLNDPKNWEVALNLFPKLKVDLAHFGSSKTWQSSSTLPIEVDPQQRKETIIDLMRNYPGVYSDFSFSLSDIKASKNLKNRLVNDELLRKKTLFGSDFWVINPQGNLNMIQDDFIHLLDEDFRSLDLKTQLCKANPMNFLFS